MKIFKIITIEKKSVEICADNVTEALDKFFDDDYDHDNVRFYQTKYKVEEA